MTRLRLLAVTVVAFAGAWGPRAVAATSRPDSAAVAAQTPATSLLPVTRHADGSLSVRPGGRFTEYLVAGRDSSGRLRMRCVQGTDRAQVLMRSRALWLRPRATR